MRLLDNLRWLAGANTGTLSWTPTANRTITLPDASGTIALMPARNIISADFVLDTAVYAIGDVLCDLLTIPNAVQNAGDTALLDTIEITDADDKASNAFTLVFFDRSVTMQAKNAAWAVSDADMKNKLGFWSIAQGDWKDFGINKSCFFTGLGIKIKPNSGTSIFVGAFCDSAVSAGTAGGLSIKLGIDY